MGPALITAVAQRADDASYGALAPPGENLEDHLRAGEVGASAPLDVGGITTADFDRAGVIRRQTPKRL